MSQTGDECKLSPEWKADWKEREEEAKQFFRGNHRYYFDEALRASKLERRLSVTALTCGTLAPVFVVLSSQQFKFGWPLAFGAIVLSWGVAICEGLKTILRPGEQWRDSMAVCEGMRIAFEEWKDKKIGLCKGSPERIQAYLELRKQVEASIEKERNSFFDALKSKNGGTGTKP
jgi:hypothetical protein